MEFIIKKDILDYFDDAVDEIVRRFCCFVNSSMDEPELLSIENEGTKKNKN
jgi:hypothetical protein